jgi:hypothetical protein
VTVSSDGKLSGSESFLFLRRRARYSRVRLNQGEAADLDRVEMLGAAEDAEEDVVELWVGPQRVPALISAAGDFDEGAFFGDEAWLS